MPPAVIFGDQVPTTSWTESDAGRVWVNQAWPPNPVPIWCRSMLARLAASMGRPVESVKVKLPPAVHDGWVGQPTTLGSRLCGFWPDRAVSSTITAVAESCPKGLQLMTRVVGAGSGCAGDVIVNEPEL